VRGATWNGSLILDPLNSTPLCPGTYRLSVSVVNCGVFGGFGTNLTQAKPFGAARFAVH
jgi:hypothetical protein